MKLTEYFNLYPELKPWNSLNNIYVLDEGMLQFNEETACCWGGPYPGNYAHYLLKDYSKINHYSDQQDKICSVAQRNSEYLLANPKIRVVDFATLEFPYTLHLSGNDDTSYSKFFATLKEAEFEIERLLVLQPLDFDIDLRDKDRTGGWVFTN